MQLKKLKFVVLDEAHSYYGSLGIELSLLMRRLTGLAPKKPRFILTSATLGEQGKSESEIVNFAKNPRCGGKLDRRGCRAAAPAQHQRRRTLYQKEDKERILADLAESGLPVAAFCKQPGKPTRQCITNWLKLAEAGQLDVSLRQVRGACEHQKHLRYPDATKREAVALLNKGMRPCDVARRLNVSSSSVVLSWARSAKQATMALAKESDMANNSNETPCTQNTKRAVWDISKTPLERDLLLQNLALREMMRDPKAGDPENLSNSAKAELGEKLRVGSGFPLKEVLRFLKISKSSYAYAKKRNEMNAKRTPEIAARVRLAFDYSKRTYGYRRVLALVQTGFDDVEPMRVTEREVRDAMREGKMTPRKTVKRRYNSYVGEPDKRPANVPLRADGTHNFFAPVPGMLAVTDITEFKCGGTKVYLSPLIDCFDGMPISWSISLHPDSSLCNSSLRAFLAWRDGVERLPKSNLVVHTDGGVQYRSHSWKAICEKAGVVRSMSRKGCCADNARAEGFFGSIKAEFYYKQDWSNVTPKKFIELLNAHIVWYREERLKKFSDENGDYYDTLLARRKRLGYAV